MRRGWDPRGAGGTVGSPRRRLRAWPLPISAAPASPALHLWGSHVSTAAPPRARQPPEEALGTAATEKEPQKQNRGRTFSNRSNAGGAGTEPTRCQERGRLQPDRLAGRGRTRSGLRGPTKQRLSPFCRAIRSKFCVCLGRGVERFPEGHPWFQGSCPPTETLRSGRVRTAGRLGSCSLSTVS